MFLQLVARRLKKHLRKAPEISWAEAGHCYLHLIKSFDKHNKKFPRVTATKTEQFERSL